MGTLLERHFSNYRNANPEWNLTIKLFFARASAPIKTLGSLLTVVKPYFNLWTVG